MKNVRIIGIASDRETLSLESMLQKSGVYVRAMLEPTDKAIKEMAKLYAEAVVLYTEKPREETFSYLRKIIENHKKFAVILLCDTSDPSVYSKAMQIGVGAVVSKDVDPEEFYKVVAEEAARNKKNLNGEGFKESTVIAVFSTKGGTGKTTVAVNMAVSFAKTGKKVCVIDLDLQFGDVGVFMNIPRSETITDMLEDSDLTPESVNSYLYQHESGVSVLCAPNSPEEADDITPEHLERIINTVRQNFDYTVLDLPPILDDNTIATVEQADYIWFITNPEISTLKNSKVCMSILQDLSLEQKIRIVLNKDSDASIKQNNVCKVLGTGIELAIPYDYATAVTAVNRGKPFVLSAPRSKASKAFEQYAKTHDELT